MLDLASIIGMSVPGLTPFFPYAPSLSPGSFTGYDKVPQLPFNSFSTFYSISEKINKIMSLKRICLVFPQVLECESPGTPSRKGRCLESKPIQ